MYLIFFEKSLCLNIQNRTIRAIIDVKRSAKNMLNNKANGINNIKIKTIFSRNTSFLKSLIKSLINLNFNNNH